MRQSSSFSAHTCCKLCCLLLILGVAAVVAFSLHRWIKTPGGTSLMGWCCPVRGQSCIGETDAVTCGDAGGFAFTRDKIVCVAACAPTTPHAAANK